MSTAALPWDKGYTTPLESADKYPFKKHRGQVEFGPHRIFSSEHRFKNYYVERSLIKGFLYTIAGVD